MRFIIYAPPGVGKSKLLAKLAASLTPSIIFVKSHLEALQTARYVEIFGGRAGLLFGRKSLCPLGAEDKAQCLRLRESGECKARSKRAPRRIYDIVELYKAGVCPYEAFHVVGRNADVFIMPLAYISKVSNVAAVSDLFEEIEFVALDEVHNLLTMVDVEDYEQYSKKYCISDHSTILCLALPLVGEITKKTPRVAAASASVTPYFADIFKYFLNAKYVKIDELPGLENLVVEYLPLRVRYKTRQSRKFIEKISQLIEEIFQQYGRIILFLPNKKLVPLYLKSLRTIPTSEKPLGDIDHVVVTYYGSPISEGVNIDVKAGILLGFPIPDVKSRELWLTVKVLDRLGFSGYKYGILFTAINHVIQAAGRVVRNLTNEKKYIILIDDRFYKYKYLLPNYLN
ncbi:MAG: helicase C-terminal domain-containing protein [Pyrobaculum sp.]